MTVKKPKSVQLTKAKFKVGQVVFSKRWNIYIKLFFRGVRTLKEGLIWHALFYPLKEHENKRITVVESDLRPLTKKETGL